MGSDDRLPSDNPSARLPAYVVGNDFDVAIFISILTTRTNKKVPRFLFHIAIGIDIQRDM